MDLGFTISEFDQVTAALKEKYPNDPELIRKQEAARHNLKSPLVFINSIITGDLKKHIETFKGEPLQEDNLTTNTIRFDHRNLRQMIVDYCESGKDEFAYFLIDTLTALPTEEKLPDGLAITTERNEYTPGKKAPIQQGIEIARSRGERESLEHSKNKMDEIKKERLIAFLTFLLVDQGVERKAATGTPVNNTDPLMEIVQIISTFEKAKQEAKQIVEAALAKKKAVTAAGASSDNGLRPAPQMRVDY